MISDFNSGIELIPNGIASDSFVMIIGYAGFIAIIVTLIAVSKQKLSDSEKPGLVRRKPLLIPSLAFVIVAVLVMQLGVVPISAYRGLNEKNVSFRNSETTNLSIYDGEPYLDSITIKVVRYLEPTESMIIHFRAFQDNTLIQSADLNLFPAAGDVAAEIEENIDLDPGSYVVNLSYSLYRDNVLQEADIWGQISIFQRLNPEFALELNTWANYQFVLIVGSIFLLLGGICIGKEERKRIAVEKVDQEPPREDIYIRQLDF
ncbi:MAG: hypothetical protein RTU30_05520 [Candidatus Thorarchaeota archaeon]